MIRNSILVAVAAIVLSLLLHGTGLVAVFGDYVPPEETQSGQDLPDTGGAFEDFADSPVEPDTPEPIPPAEPEEPDIVTPEEPTSAVEIASDAPQDVVTPDSGTATTEGGGAEQVAEATKPEVVNPEESAAAAPQGNPEAEATAEPIEADEVIAALAPEVPDVTEPLGPTVEVPDALEEAEDEIIEGAAVTRSLRPPAERPNQDTFGLEQSDGENEEAEVAGSGTLQRTGLDLLSEAGNAVVYGRNGLDTARAAGNASETNYAGEVLLKLNRPRARSRGEKGNARVQFEISPDGSVAWVRILSSNGSAKLERDAAAAVRRAAPFPPPPNGTTRRFVFVYRSQ